MDFADFLAAFYPGSRSMTIDIRDIWVDMELNNSVTRDRVSISYPILNSLRGSSSTPNFGDL